MLSKYINLLVITITKFVILCAPTLSSLRSGECIPSSLLIKQTIAIYTCTHAAYCFNFFLLRYAAYVTNVITFVCHIRVHKYSLNPPTILTRLTPTPIRHDCRDITRKKRMAIFANTEFYSHVKETNTLLYLPFVHESLNNTNNNIVMGRDVS